jgi:hypothetical protein
LVCFTRGFLAIAIAAQAESSENQWVVVLQQHYYTHELQRTARLKNALGKVVGTRLLPAAYSPQMIVIAVVALIAEWLLTMIEDWLLTWRPKTTVNG